MSHAPASVSNKKQRTDGKREPVSVPVMLSYNINTEAGMHPNDAMRAQNQWAHNLQILENRRRTETLSFLNIVAMKLTPYEDVFADEYIEKTTRECQALLRLCGHTWDSEL